MNKPAIAAFLLAAMIVSSCATKQPSNGTSLTVVSWGGAYTDTQRKAFFKPYTSSTGTEILERQYDGGLDKVRAMVQAKNVTWDVIDVDAAHAVDGCDQGLFEKLDMSKIGDTAAFLPGSVLDCAVGTVAYSTILAFDADKLTQDPPTSLADFFDLQQHPGKRGLLKNAAGNLEWALLADGVPITDVYKALATPAGVDRAFAKLDTIKSEIVWWESGAQPLALLDEDKVVMSSAWHARVNDAIKSGKNYKIVWDFQALDWDFWAIVKDTPNINRAYDFVKFASDPKIMAQHSKYIDYGPTRTDAAALIDPAIAAHLPTQATNVATAFSIDPRFWSEHGGSLNSRFNAWLAR
ncbi:ABC transporter substrate-binding protein [Dongia rigui]|uniref:ABC transporter substrate-binding protein n=1 Tax=Dongia rigui TaxID=940149 RepID=A0ABU5E1A4_9PROT|nr:ABC transporter substrate-binding protein [Dongia rigui]MDY0873340.1 ABC transporter substrate-binding protein [Dongia rigui]